MAILSSFTMALFATLLLGVDSYISGMESAAADRQRRAFLRHGFLD